MSMQKSDKMEKSDTCVNENAHDEVMYDNNSDVEYEYDDDERDVIYELPDDSDYYSPDDGCEPFNMENHLKLNQDNKNKIFIVETQKKLNIISSELNNKLMIRDNYETLKQQFSVLCDELKKYKIIELNGNICTVNDIPLIKISICEIDEKLVQIEEILFVKEENDLMLAEELQLKEFEHRHVMFSNMRNMYNKRMHSFDPTNM